MSSKIAKTKHGHLFSNHESDVYSLNQVLEIEKKLELIKDMLSASTVLQKLDNLLTLDMETKSSKLYKAATEIKNSYENIRSIIKVGYY